MLNVPVLFQGDLVMAIALPAFLNQAQRSRAAATVDPLLGTSTAMVGTESRGLIHHEITHVGQHSPHDRDEILATGNLATLPGNPTIAVASTEVLANSRFYVEAEPATDTGIGTRSNLLSLNSTSYGLGNAGNITLTAGGTGPTL
jgi:hypothetical protein